MLSAVSQGRPLHELLEETPDGERRIGPYVLRAPLGRGGSAPVWVAEETYFGVPIRTVAVKLFSVPRVGSPDAIARRHAVVEEARRLSQIRHPNVVLLHGLAVDEARDMLGLVMEHLVGESLAERLRARVRPSIDEVLAVGRAVASALAAAHAAQIVHRDVKPANVVATGDRWTLIDFGISEPSADSPSTRPPSGVRVVGDVPIDLSGLGTLELAKFTVGPTQGAATFSGTIGYACPHCVSSPGASSTGCDLYALGALLFECLTGVVPAASRPGTPGLAGEILDGRAAPPSVATLRADVPPELAQLVDLLLAPDPADRPRAALLVAARLDVLSERRAPERWVPGENRPATPAPPDFEIVRPFMDQGIASVSLARHRSSGRTACLEVSRAPASLAARRLEFAADLAHPNIAELRAYGSVEGRPWFEFEACDEMLGAHAAAGVGQVLVVEEAHSLLDDVLGALAHVHAAGIVHRDVTPGSIWVQLGGARAVAKLSGFWLAYVPRRHAALEDQGKAVGTPRYMSAEALAARGQRFDDDVWGVAATFYQAVTGQLPRPEAEGVSLERYIADATTARVVPIRERLPACPPAFAGVIDRALRPRDERYRDAREMLAALRSNEP